MKKDISNAEGVIRNLDNKLKEAMTKFMFYQGELEKTTDQKKFLEIKGLIDEKSVELRVLEADIEM